jgi:hypothetical protein
MFKPFFDFRGHAAVDRMVECVYVCKNRKVKYVCENLVRPLLSRFYFQSENIEGFIFVVKNIPRAVQYSLFTAYLFFLFPH